MLRYQDILSGQILLKNGLTTPEAVKRCLESRSGGVEDSSELPSLLEMLVENGDISADRAKTIQKAQALTQFVRAERLYAKIIVERGLVDREILQACFEEQTRQRYKVRIANLLLERGAITSEQNEQVTDEELRRLSEEIEEVEARGYEALAGDNGGENDDLAALGLAVVEDGDASGAVPSVHDARTVVDRPAASGLDHAERSPAPALEATIEGTPPDLEDDAPAPSRRPVWQPGVADSIEEDEPISAAPPPPAPTAPVTLEATVEQEGPPQSDDASPFAEPDPTPPPLPLPSPSYATGPVTLDAPDEGEPEPVIAAEVVPPTAVPTAEPIPVAAPAPAPAPVPAPAPTAAPVARGPGHGVAKRGALTGKVISNRYRILEPIAEGGMGVVYRAEHVLMEKTLAFKVLHSALLKSHESVERFKREVRALSSFRHRNVVQITDAGVGEGEIYYMAMELVDGEGLDVLMKREGGLTVERSIGIVRQILSAVGEAHKVGIVHRDLKPENIIIAADRHGMDVVKVMDFGVVKVLDPDEALAQGPEDDGGTDIEILFKTQEGTVTGTPQYMSPEQASSQPIDGRSDLYATGVILFEMLTGRLPFESETSIGYLGKHILEDVPSFAEVRPDLAVPPALEQVVMRLLEKKPSDRFQTAQEVADAIEQRVIGKLFALPGESGTLSAPAQPVAPASADAPGPFPPPVAPSRPSPPAAGGRTELVPVAPASGIQQARTEPAAASAGRRKTAPEAEIGGDTVDVDRPPRRSEPEVPVPPSRGRSLAVAGVCTIVTIVLAVGAVALFRTNRQSADVSTVVAASPIGAPTVAELVKGIGIVEDALELYPGDPGLVAHAGALEKERIRRLEKALADSKSSWSRVEGERDVAVAASAAAETVAAWRDATALGAIEAQKPFPGTLEELEARASDLAREAEFSEHTRAAEAALEALDVDAAAEAIEALGKLDAKTEEEEEELATLVRRLEHTRLVAAARTAEKSGDVDAALDLYRQALAVLDVAETRTAREKLRNSSERGRLEIELEKLVGVLAAFADGNDESTPEEIETQRGRANELAEKLGGDAGDALASIGERVDAALVDARDYLDARAAWAKIEGETELALETFDEAAASLAEYIERGRGTGAVHVPRAQRDYEAVQQARAIRARAIDDAMTREREARKAAIAKHVTDAGKLENERDVGAAIAKIKTALALAGDDEVLRKDLEETEARLRNLADIISEIPESFVRVPPGEFPMGPDKTPVHVDEFYVATFELTQLEWEPFIRAHPDLKPADWGESGKAPLETRDFPITGVTLKTAKLFCEWLNKRSAVVHIRLPTEAEWEKAASGTEGLIYPWGDSFASTRVSLVRLAAIKSTKDDGSSPYGCHDMAGNVAEWTTTEGDDGQVVVKGGSYFSDENDLKTSARRLASPDEPATDIGIRLVLTLPKAGGGGGD